jgi:hypothetical protein
MHSSLSFVSKLCNIILATNTMENYYAYVFVFILYLDDLCVLVIDLNDVNSSSLHECD